MRRTVAVLGSGILLVALAACSSTDSTVPPQPPPAPSASEAASPVDPAASSTPDALATAAAPATSTATSPATSPDDDEYLTYAMPANCNAVASPRILDMWYSLYPYADFSPSVFPDSDVPSLAPDGIACSWGVDGLGQSWLTLSAAGSAQFDPSTVYAALESEGYTRTDLGDETYFTRVGDVRVSGAGDDDLGVGAGVALFTPAAWFQASTTTGGEDLVQTLAKMTQDMRDRLHLDL